MSRFFDALKQANLSELNGTEIPLEVGVGGDHEGHSTYASSKTSSHDAVIPVSTPIAPTIDPWELAPKEHKRQDPLQNSAFTALARAAVDQNVRMIPNAAD